MTSEQRININFARFAFAVYQQKKHSNSSISSLIQPQQEEEHSPTAITRTRYKAVHEQSFATVNGHHVFYVFVGQMEAGFTYHRRVV